jgi:hypothetical protein
VSNKSVSAKVEANELTYADEHPVIYSDLPTKSKDRAERKEKLAEFSKHSPAWQADWWDRATPEDRGVIAAEWDEPLHADLGGFEPKELTDLERQQVKSQVEQLKATKHFLDAETVAAITEAEQEREQEGPRADAGLQKLLHLYAGIQTDVQSRLPFQTPHRVSQKVVGEDGKKKLVWTEKPDMTTTARTADGGAIVTEFDFGTGQIQMTEFSAEEAAELRAQLMLEDPKELPLPLGGSEIVDEFSRPVSDYGVRSGEATEVPQRIQVSPFAAKGPETPQAFLEVHGKITRDDVKLWPADTTAKFNRDFPDAARSLLRGDEVTELS